jgi:hypothetical protein
MVWNSGTTTTTSHEFQERYLLHPNDPLRSFNPQQWKTQPELKIVHSKVRCKFVKYAAIHIQVQAPKYNGGSRAKAALTIVADQIKMFLEKLQMIDKSALLIPFQARYHIGADTELLDDPELVECDYDLIKVYVPEIYVHNRDTFMYSKVLMCFKKVSYWGMDKPCTSDLSK